MIAPKHLKLSIVQGGQNSVIAGGQFSVAFSKLSHDGGDAVLTTLKKNMNVVVHEDPGINRTFPLDNILSEAFEKARLVIIVVEYVG